MKRGRRKNNKTSRSSGAALAEPKGDRFESGVRVAEPPFLYAPRRMALLRAARRPSVWDATIRAGENPATYGAQRERRYGRAVRVRHAPPIVPCRRGLTNRRLAKTTGGSRKGWSDMKNWKKWAKAAAVRAIKTVAQTAVGVIGASALISEVNWLTVVSAAGLAGVVSLLTSVAGLPECKEE